MLKVKFHCSKSSFCHSFVFDSVAFEESGSALGPDTPALVTMMMSIQDWAIDTPGLGPQMQTY